MIIDKIKVIANRKRFLTSKGIHMIERLIPLQNIKSAKRGVVICTMIFILLACWWAAWIDSGHYLP